MGICQIELNQAVSNPGIAFKSGGTYRANFLHLLAINRVLLWSNVRKALSSVGTSCL
jgi:hypothetical protein